MPFRGPLARAASGRGVRHGDHPAIVRLGEALQEVGAPVAVADERDADHGSGPCSPQPATAAVAGWAASACLTRRAGLPTTILWAGTSLVTTALAPHDGPRTDLKAGEHRRVRPDRGAPRRTMVVTTCQSASVCGSPLGDVARGCRSLVNMTPWPMNTSSSIVTPSQMKVWRTTDFAPLKPTEAFFWTSTNCPDARFFSDDATVKVHEVLDGGLSRHDRVTCRAIYGH